MSVTIESSGDAEEIVELLRQVHEEHRQRRPQWFKPKGCEIEADDAHKS